MGFPDSVSLGNSAAEVWAAADVVKHSSGHPDWRRRGVCRLPTAEPRRQALGQGSGRAGICRTLAARSSEQCCGDDIEYLQHCIYARPGMPHALNPAGFEPRMPHASNSTLVRAARLCSLPTRNPLSSHAPRDDPERSSAACSARFFYSVSVKIMVLFVALYLSTVSIYLSTYLPTYLP